MDETVPTTWPPRPGVTVVDADYKCEKQGDKYWHVWTLHGPRMKKGTAP